MTGKVYFIGAGPGDPDLLTVRAVRLLGEADMVVWADSLISPQVVSLCRPDAAVHGSASLTRDEIARLMTEAAMQGKVVARLHSGDPSLYGALLKEMRVLEEVGIPYEVVPGVSSPFAAALKVELTAPGISQTVIVTRAPGRTPMPEGEDLRALAHHGATLALFLSAARLREAVAALVEGGYAPDTPAAIVYRASWPDELVLRGAWPTCPAWRGRRASLARPSCWWEGLWTLPSRDPRGLPPACTTRPSATCSVGGGRMRAEGAVRRLIAAVAITRRGAEMASVLARRLHGVELYVEERWAGGLGACCHAFRLPLRSLIADLFARYPSLILFTAVGVAVRLLAPLLSGKGRDPAVATVDEGGRFVVCLLSGHRGGEALAREVASVLGAVPVLTSASAALGLPALDLPGVDRGWRLEGEEDLTAVAAALVNGGPVAFYQDAGERPWTEAPPGILEVSSLDDALALGAPRIVVSDRLLPDGVRDGAPTLVYRPRTLVAGVGCRRGVGGVRIAALVRSVLEGNGLSPLSLRCLATPEAKAGELGLTEAARLLDVPLVTLPADRLRRVAGLVSPSASERLLGLPSVSEALALAAAGDARLLVPRAKDGQVTVVARWEGEE